MSREDEIKEMLNKTAEEFKYYDTNPLTWTSWVVYLLQQLQQQAFDVNPLHQAQYEDMLLRLQDAIRNRLRTGGW